MQPLAEAGYQVFPDVFADCECAELLDRLSTPEVARSRAGARHLYSLPFVAELSNDSRLMTLAASALGQRRFRFV